MIRRYLFGFVIAFFAIVFTTSVSVEAKEVLKHAKADNGSEIVGSIYLYDDYTVAVSYRYRLKELSVMVCEGEECVEVAPKGQTYLNSEPFTDMGVWNADLSEYIQEKEVKTVYTVTVSGQFKMSPSAVSSSTISVSHDIEKEVSVNDNNDKEEEVFASLDKVINILNTWIIPGLYAILAVWIIVKGILLSIDLMKHSDDPAIRKEKLRAFAYLTAALLCVALLNTMIGFLTGLFG